MKKVKIKQIICVIMALISLFTALPIYANAEELTQREKIVKIALAEVGNSGRPNKYTRWYGSSGGSYSYAWCGVFVSWCAHKAGIPETVIYPSASAVCNSFDVPYHKYKSTANVRPGDIFYVENNVTYHTGIVVEVTDKYIYTVEGNMSNSVKKVQYSRKTGHTVWSTSSQWQKILYYGVPEYTDDRLQNIGKTVYYNGNKYVVYDCRVTWKDAQQLCTDLGGHLATIASAGEYNAVKTAVAESEVNCWIGASDSAKEGKWLWTDGKAVKYKAWAQGQPDNAGGNQDYAFVNYKTGLWQDAGAASTVAFVCEFDNAVKPVYKLYNNANNHTYVYYDETLTWDEAVEYCKYIGAHIATVTTSDEENIVKKLLKGRKSAWAGGYSDDSVGKWLWKTGEEFDLTYWKAASTDDKLYNNPRLLILNDGSWSEADKDKRHGFICEYDHTHKYYNEPTVTKKATPSEKGTLFYECCCGKKNVKAINRVSRVKLEYTSAVYDGKAKKPTVIVKDSDGKVLSPQTDYTVSYSSGRKAVGKYKVNVVFKGKYSGKKQLEFKIIPKSTQIISAKKGKTSATIKLKKVGGVSGYEIWYYSAASGKYVKDGETTKTSYVFSDLIAGKKYKLKVRTYKTVGTVKYYSKFSSAFSVKIKKTK